MNTETPAKGNVMGKCLPARYVFAVLGSIGLAIVYGLKVNLSVTMVAMVMHSHPESSDDKNSTKSSDDTNNKLKINFKDGQCQPPDDMSESENEQGPFQWSDTLQGTLLSCYFWGYLVSQIPLARVAEIYSAKWVFFFAVASNVICTLLTPELTKLHYGGLICMRIIEGIGGGASFAPMHIMISNWAPKKEQVFITSLIYVGTSAGTAVSILMSGLIAASLGWEWVFYIMGGLSSIWLVLWIILIQDTPNTQRFISPEERDMINGSQGKDPSHNTHSKLPIVQILQSEAFWAILIAHTCSNFGWYMFLIEMPLYMNQVLKFNLARNVIFSALPYLPMLMFTIILGWTLDVLQAREKISRTVARKMATAICTVIPSICLIGLCFVGCLHYLAVGFSCIGIISMGAMFCGFLANHIDIAPNFAGTLVALTNTVATVPGIIVPQLVGFITEGNKTIESWRIIFSITIIFFIIELIVYTTCGSGKLQPWND